MQSDCGLNSWFPGSKYVSLFSRCAHIMFLSSIDFEERGVMTIQLFFQSISLCWFTFFYPCSTSTTVLYIFCIYSSVLSKCSFSNPNNIFYIYIWMLSHIIPMTNFIITFFCTFTILFCIFSVMNICRVDTSALNLILRNSEHARF